MCCMWASHNMSGFMWLHEHVKEGMTCSIVALLGQPLSQQALADQSLDLSKWLHVL